LSAPLVTARDLSVRFEARAGLWGARGVVHAVEAVDLEIQRGETLALVGETGSGKTTLGRALLGLVPLHAGSVRFEGQELARLSQQALRPLRKRMQTIFQDPYASLSPRRTVGQTVGEALAIHGMGTPASRADHVARLLRRVGLSAEMADRLPRELSGGQRQRVGIARALAVEPAFIVADEPVSSLDASIQAQILNLLVDLQGELGLTYLFITHDLNVVEYLADRVAVMYLGRIVELAPVDALFAHPQHPYTEALLRAVPRLGTAGTRTVLAGEPPSALAPPAGCAFSSRCPHATERCHKEVPPSFAAGPGHQVACFLHESSIREPAA